MALAQTDATCSPDAYTGPSAAEYKRLSSDIDADCKGRADDLRRKHEERLKELEDECLRQKRILAGKEDVHADEKADVKEQEKVVAKEKMDVKEAKIKVKELAQCPPELVQAKEELAEQEAIPNDLPQDIDAECKAQKLVLEKEACVEELRAAERVLSGHAAEHSAEKSDLSGEESEKDHAATKIPPQEKRVEEACQAFEDLKKKGPSQHGFDELNKRCQDKKDALLKEADAAIEALLNDYLRQKKILEGKEDVHADEKADVDQQEKVVVEERIDVKEAKVVVKRNAHCPPELVKAKEELSQQQAIPNDSSEDIDAECVARKAVMEAEQCVEALRKAEAVLGTQRGEHKKEGSHLDAEAQEEDEAAAALPPQEKIVCELKAALDAARAARKGLSSSSPSSDGDASPASSGEDAASASKEKSEKKEAEEQQESEKKSAATRSAAGVAVVAMLLAAFVQG